MLAARGGCRVTVATTTADGKRELPVFKKEPRLVDGVPVFYFPRWVGDPVQFSPALLGWLWKNVRRFDAVHIHSWWNVTVLLSVGICVIRGVRPVLSPRGMLSPFSLSGRAKATFHRLAGRFLLKKTFLHATSEQELRECRELLSDWEGAVLPNFLTLPSTSVFQKKEAAPGRLRLLFLSRIHQKKGLELLFEALATASFDWSLDIAGDGEAEYIDSLKSLSEKLGIAPRVRWLGWVGAGERQAAFQSADLMVLPSHNENFANAVVESLAAGTPVLVSRHVGLSDYVSEKKLGWVCDTTAGDISQKLAEIAAAPTELERVSATCAEQVGRDFDPDVLVKKYLELYQKLKK